MNKKRKVCMIVQNKMVKGGIAAVVNGYRGSQLETEFEVTYVESYNDGSKVKKIIKAIGGYIHFLKVLFIDRPDIVHIHSSFGPSFYRKIPYIYLSSWMKKPIINHCHGADFSGFFLRANSKKQKLIKKVYNMCSTIIALSDEWKNNLSIIVPLHKVKVIENYSIVYEQGIAERINRGNNKQVLFLGEIGRRKGCYDIPSVIEKVVEEIPNVKFILGGSGDIDSIKELLRKKEIEHNVIFPGWVRGKEKDKLLRESDVFFLPSYNEGMPMSILDAMGYGLPIVSTEVGGIPKIVVNDRNGYTCRPGDINDLSESLIRILRNDEIRTNYAISSFNTVKEAFSLDSHLKRLTNLYNEILHTRS